MPHIDGERRIRVENALTLKSWVPLLSLLTRFIPNNVRARVIRQTESTQHRGLSRRQSSLPEEGGERNENYQRRPN